MLLPNLFFRPDILVRDHQWKTWQALFAWFIAWALVVTLLMFAPAFGDFSVEIVADTFEFALSSMIALGTFVFVQVIRLVVGDFKRDSFKEVEEASLSEKYEDSSLHPSPSMVVQVASESVAEESAIASVVKEELSSVEADKPPKEITDGKLNSSQILNSLKKDQKEEVDQEALLKQQKIAIDQFVKVIKDKTNDGQEVWPFPGPFMFINKQGTSEMFEILKDMQTDDGRKLSLSPSLPLQDQPKCIACEVTVSQYEIAKVIQSEVSAKLHEIPTKLLCQEISQKFQKDVESLYKDFYEEVKNTKLQARAQLFSSPEPKDVFSIELNTFKMELKAKYEEPLELKGNPAALVRWKGLGLREEIIEKYRKKGEDLVIEPAAAIEAEIPTDVPQTPVPPVKPIPPL